MVSPFSTSSATGFQGHGREADAGHGVAPRPCRRGTAQRTRSPPARAAVAPRLVTAMPSPRLLGRDLGRAPPCPNGQSAQARSWSATRGGTGQPRDTKRGRAGCRAGMASWLVCLARRRASSPRASCCSWGQPPTSFAVEPDGWAGHGAVHVEVERLARVTGRDVEGRRYQTGPQVSGGPCRHRGQWAERACSGPVVRQAHGLPTTVVGRRRASRPGLSPADQRAACGALAGRG